MERKILSSLTEFYKVYGILCIVIFFAVFGLELFDLSDFPISLILLLLLAGNLFIAFDFWRMKEVEMTDTGLLISRRFFFDQKTIFVPYEKIEAVKNKFGWLGNNHRTTIKFSEVTEFGPKISFLSKGIRRTSQNKIVEELNRAIFRHNISEKLNSAPNQFDN